MFEDISYVFNCELGFMGVLGKFSDMCDVIAVMEEGDYDVILVYEMYVDCI